MAQLTLYLDEDTARRTRLAARRSGKSLSAWARECLRKAATEGDEWPDGYFDLFGSVSDATFVRPGELDMQKDSPREAI